MRDLRLTDEQWIALKVHLGAYIRAYKSYFNPEDLTPLEQILLCLQPPTKKEAPPVGSSSIEKNSESP